MARLGLLLHLNFLPLVGFVQYHEPCLFHVFFHLGWPHWVYKLCAARLVTNIISNIYFVKAKLKFKFKILCLCGEGQYVHVWVQMPVESAEGFRPLELESPLESSRCSWPWHCLPGHRSFLCHTPSATHYSPDLSISVLLSSGRLTIWLKLKIKKIWHGNAC